MKVEEPFLVAVIVVGFLFAALFFIVWLALKTVTMPIWFVGSLFFSETHHSITSELAKA